MLATAGCHLEVDRGPDWLLVKVLALDEDRSASPQLADRIWQLLEQHFTYRVVLEMDQIATLDSHAIEQLIQLYQRISEHNGVLRLCGLSPQNRRALQACAMDDHLRSYDSREEAVMGCCDPRRPK